jgi:hypothetical protein
MKNRVNFPEAFQIEVFKRCRRRCALCYGLKSDWRWKYGQFSHIDRNPKNAALGNAAYLCHNHHDEYDGTRKQSKRFKPAELKYYQKLLYRDLPSLVKTGLGARASVRGSASGVSLEVYDRRVPIYQTTRQFVRDVASNLRPGLQLIPKFAADTDEALFLFDDSLAKYLETLFTNALRLHTTDLLRERMQTHPDEAENFQAIAKEQTSLAMWLTEQPEEIRARFAPFLRLG